LAELNNTISKSGLILSALFYPTISVIYSKIIAPASSFPKFDRKSSLGGNQTFRQRLKICQTSKTQTIKSKHKRKNHLFKLLAVIIGIYLTFYINETK
jgi:hypothetical protein